MIKHYSQLERDYIDEHSPYSWRDIKSNGAKNPRANKKKKISDEEYLEKISRRDNSQALNQIGSSFSSLEFY